MSYRIGVATYDGVHVDQHFGRANRFLILDVEDGGDITEIEDRIVTPVCCSGQEHPDIMNENARILSDCNFVLCSRIGDSAAYALRQNGITAVELPGRIEDSVDKLMSYLKVVGELAALMKDQGGENVK